MKYAVGVLTVIVVIAIYALWLTGNDLQRLQAGGLGKPIWKLTRVYHSQGEAWEEYQALKRQGLNPKWEVKK